MLIIQIPGESVRKFYPEHDSLGYGFRFAYTEIEVGKILESRVRVFPLSGPSPPDDPNEKIPLAMAAGGLEIRR